MITMGVQLPQIVITGDKNTGKSSLVASICGVSVPGTTSVATKWQIAPGLWSASVYLLWDGFPFGEPRHTHFLYREMIPDAETSITTIKMAQTTVSLGRSYTPFNRFPYSKDKVNEIHENLSVFPEYSRHIIHVVLCAPYIPFEMVMVDLPGVISSRKDVEMVKALVLSYLNVEGNVIILMMPVASDETRHSSLKIVKEADPEFRRTIALLTKADIFDRGVKRWLDILDGKTTRAYPSFSTYYSPKSSEFTPRQAHLDELTFFDTVDPWAALGNRHSLGANALVWAAKRLHDNLSHRRNRSGNMKDLMFEYGTDLRLRRAHKDYHSIP